MAEIIENIEAGLNSFRQIAASLGVADKMMLQKDVLKGDIILYRSPEGGIELDVRLQQETVWLSQKQMSDLLGKDVRTINEHVRNVFDDGELEQDRTIRNFRIVSKEVQRQVRREIEHYNLDMVISVGYRVKSLQGVLLLWFLERNELPKHPHEALPYGHGFFCSG